MSWLAHLFGFGDEPEPEAVKAAEEPSRDDTPSRFVNLTGRTICFCRAIPNSLYYEVKYRLETSGPVPKVRKVTHDDSDTKALVACGDDIWTVPVFESDSELEHEEVDDLREEQEGVILIVNFSVFAVVQYSRNDVVYVTALDSDLVRTPDPADKKAIYCTGIMRT